MKRWVLISVWVFVLCLFFGSIALTQQQGKVEIGGLIINQTQTRIGQEFYQNFVIFWQAPSGMKDYNIFVAEMTNPVWGNYIWIEVGGFISKEIVYGETFKSRSGQEEIEQAARKGVEMAAEYVRRANFD
ncbi:MAG: CsgE family curli-type amyloid fiber assembly protein [bacterium]